jgi:hypothetical protein
MLAQALEKTDVAAMAFDPTGAKLSIFTRKGIEIIDLQTMLATPRYR